MNETTNGASPLPRKPKRSVVVLDLVADKWTMRVVYNLTEGPKYYGELLRSIGDISKKMLTQTLRALERNGFVMRTVNPTNPPTVQYELTALGRSLLKAIVVLCDWAKENYQEVEQAQAAYDEHDAKAQEAQVS